MITGGPVVAALFFALSLPSLAAELARVVARLVVTTMTAIVMVVDVGGTICNAVFVVFVRVFVFVDTDARVVGDQGHAFSRSDWCFPLRG
jgi:hypothetical protein